MAYLTPAESDRIIQTHLDSSGATAPSLMAAWRAMVYQMLEHLDLGQYRTECIALAHDIVELWSGVQLAYTYPPDYQFLFMTGEVEQVRNLFGELNRLALVILSSHPKFPPRSRTDSEQAVEHIDEIAGYVRDRLALLDETEAKNKGDAVVYATAGELISVLNRCMTLLTIVLGPKQIEAFKSQYDACIVTWDQAIRLIRADTDSPPN